MIITLLIFSLLIQGFRLYSDYAINKRIDAIDEKVLAIELIREDYSNLVARYRADFLDLNERVTEDNKQLKIVSDLEQKVLFRLKEIEQDLWDLNDFRVLSLKGSLKKKKAKK